MARCDTAEPGVRQEAERRPGRPESVAPPTEVQAAIHQLYQSVVLPGLACRAPQARLSRVARSRHAESQNYWTNRRFAALRRWSPAQRYSRSAAGSLAELPRATLSQERVPRFESMDDSRFLLSRAVALPKKRCTERADSPALAQLDRPCEPVSAGDAGAAHDADDAARQRMRQSSQFEKRC